MKIIVAETDLYEMSVDSDINRMYYRPYGNWRNFDFSPDFITHVKECMAFVKPGFSMLMNCVEFTNPSIIFEERVSLMANFILYENELRQIAFVMPVNEEEQNIIRRMMGKAQERNSKIIRKTFVTVEEAEKWLDENP